MVTLLNALVIAASVEIVLMVPFWVVSFWRGAILSQQNKHSESTELGMRVVSVNLAVCAFNILVYVGVALWN